MIRPTRIPTIVRATTIARAIDTQSAPRTKPSTELVHDLDQAHQVGVELVELLGWNLELHDGLATDLLNRIAS